jgi:hypothetical protein
MPLYQIQVRIAQSIQKKITQFLAYFQVLFSKSKQDELMKQALYLVFYKLDNSRSPKDTHLVIHYFACIHRMLQHITINGTFFADSRNLKNKH